MTVVASEMEIRRKIPIVSVSGQNVLRFPEAWNDMAHSMSQW
jgi:hypothetical protein